MKEEDEGKKEGEGEGEVKSALILARRIPGVVLNASQSSTT